MHLMDSPMVLRIRDFMAGRPTEPRSPQWGPLRNKIVLAHPFCAICGWAKDLNAHHILPFHLYPNLELVESNLIVLGEKCPTGNHHLLFGHFGNWTKWNPDVVELASLLFSNFKQHADVFKPLPILHRVA